jgi:hypothetical protein
MCAQMYCLFPPQRSQIPLLPHRYIISRISADSSPALQLTVASADPNYAPLATTVVPSRPSPSHHIRVYPHLQVGHITHSHTSRLHLRAFPFVAWLCCPNRLPPLKEGANVSHGTVSFVMPAERLVTDLKHTITLHLLQVQKQRPRTGIRYPVPANSALDPTSFPPYCMAGCVTYWFCKFSSHLRNLQLLWGIGDKPRWGITSNQPSSNIL